MTESNETPIINRDTIEAAEKEATKTTLQEKPAVTETDHSVELDELGEVGEYRAELDTQDVEETKRLREVVASGGFSKESNKIGEDAKKAVEEACLNSLRATLVARFMVSLTANSNYMPANAKPEHCAALAARVLATAEAMADSYMGSEHVKGAL